MTGRKWFRYVDRETTIAFVILLVGMVSIRSEDFSTLGDAFAQGRGELGLKKARGYVAKVVRVVECAGSRNKARGRIASRNSRTTWVVCS